MPSARPGRKAEKARPAPSTPPPSNHASASCVSMRNPRRRCSAAPSRTDGRAPGTYCTVTGSAGGCCAGALTWGEPAQSRSLAAPGANASPGAGFPARILAAFPFWGFFSWPLWPPPSLQRLHAQPRFPTAARSQLSMRCAIASAPSFAQPRGYVAHRLRWMLSREVPLLVGCVVCVYGVFGGSAATGGPRARISGAEELDRRRHNVHRVRLTARQRGRAGVGASRPRRTAKRGIGIAPARYRRDRRHASMWKDME